MQVVVLLEFAPQAAGTRQALLDRIGALALKGQGRLGFVAAERDGDGRPVREVISVGFRNAALASSIVAGWRAEGLVSDALAIRSLAIEPLWPIEPLALMFP